MDLIARQKWIEAGKILAEDPQIKVLCPECGQYDLQVIDIRSELDQVIVERKMSCPFCYSKNYIRLRRPI